MVFQDGRAALTCMTSNKLYFTEFIFSVQNEGESYYYFPILIKGVTAETAAGVRGRIVEVLHQTFDQVKFLPLRLFRDPLFAKTLKSFAEFPYCAELYKLNLENMQLLSLESPPIQLDPLMRIVPQNLQLILRHTIHHHLERSALLVTQFSKDMDFKKDFLILKMVLTR